MGNVSIGPFTVARQGSRWALILGETGEVMAKGTRSGLKEVALALMDEKVGRQLVRSAGKRLEGVKLTDEAIRFKSGR